MVKKMEQRKWNREDGIEKMEQRRWNRENGWNRDNGWNRENGIEKMEQRKWNRENGEMKIKGKNKRKQDICLEGGFMSMPPSAFCFSTSLKNLISN